ncbi:hypothetical protein HY637_01440, partial [Candidatus Woesearchaeota archaeon]|nr:hypothetical protein [Candidatus Woesearchaeota archaeon]
MKFDLSEIKLSRKDVKRGLRFPEEMNEKLAEDIGIMIGDGCIGSYKNNNLTNNFISVDGNSLTDQDYLLRYVSNLKSNLYNLNFNSLFKKNRNEMRIQLNSQGLVQFYTKVIGLPLGKKINIGIPQCIWKNDNFIKACLRGIMDTDSSFQIKMRKYPVIKLATASQNLVDDCKKAFEIIGIETSTKTNCTSIHSVTKRPYITNYLYLSGREKFKKYMENIGFSNQNNLQRYYLWKSNDFCPRPYNRKVGPVGFQ